MMVKVLSNYTSKVCLKIKINFEINLLIKFSSIYCLVISLFIKFSLLVLLKFVFSLFVFLFYFIIIFLNISKEATFSSCFSSSSRRIHTKCGCCYFNCFTNFFPINSCLSDSWFLSGCC